MLINTALYDADDFFNFHTPRLKAENYTQLYFTTKWSQKTK